MKRIMLICAPVSSRSGYGSHSRDLVLSFLAHGKYDIKIIDVPWGECPRNALNKDNLNDKKILDCIIVPPDIKGQPDIYVDIRIPNEFQTYGKFNIGITAGVETTIVSAKWIEGCNKMDLVIVPSNHSKAGFAQAVYDKVQNLPDGKQKKIGELKLEKPIEVLFEGADENIYKSLKVDEIDTDFFEMLNDKVPEKFAFLSVGQWTKGGYGEDRKDLGKTIKVFYETFANKKKQPALIMKTSGATYSIGDKEEILRKINELKIHFPPDWKLPNVYLLHGDLTDNEMNYLYNHPKVKCMVSFTHGEGFGRPLLEATMTGLPVIASNWSGQVDFLNPESTLLIGGKLEEIPESIVWEDVLIKGSKWFNIDELNANKSFNYAFSEPYIIKNKAKSLMHENTSKFKLSDMKIKLDGILEKYIKMSNLSTPVKIKLPKLKRVVEEVA